MEPGRVDPGVRRVLYVVTIVLACIAALVGGYAGVTYYVDRADDPTPIPQAAGPIGAPAVPPATTPPGPGTLVVHGTGDVNLDRDQLGLLASGYAEPWTGVRDLFRADDLTIVNLECAAGAGGVRQDKEFTFRCDTGAYPAMREAGVDVANQANNHSGDFGPRALLAGRANLEGARIEPVGAGRDADEANSPAIFERKGRTVAVLGFGGVVPTPGWVARANHPGVSDGYSIDSMVRAVRAASNRSDLVFVTTHWGKELDTTPRDDQVARAHALIDAGADAIFGHHAHRLQPLQWYKGRPIAFGLGNFVWPASGAGARTAVAEVVVSPRGAISACLLPATIRGGRPVLEGAHSC